MSAPTTEPSTARHPLAPFVGHLIAVWPRVLVAMLLSWGVTALNLSLPRYYKLLTDQAFAGQGTREQRADELVTFIAAVVLILLLRRICQSSASYTAQSVTQRVALGVRQQLYDHLHRLRLEFFDDQRTGALVSSITNDVTTIQYLLHDGMVEIFSAPLTVLGAVVLVFLKDVQLGATALLVFPAVYLLIQQASGRMRRLAHRNQQTMSHLTALFLETVANIRIVRAFCRQDFEIGRFRQANLNSLATRLRNARWAVCIEFATEMVALMGFAAVLYLGGLRSIDGHLTTGDLIAIVAYLATIRSAVTSLSVSYNRYQQAVGAATRLLAVLAEPPVPVVTATPAVDHDEWQGALRLQDVDFAYPEGTPVLRGASLSIAPGERVALVGQSGVGKSTLASLLLGLYTHHGGRIEIDGVELSELPPERLLALVSIVPQEVGLFSGTVRENIAYARLEASDEEVEDAARAANAHDFITRLSQGYDTFVGDQGVKLSGGQRQRIAIARAILRNPRILILDEATSHVDAQTAALVQEALARLTTGRTVLIIAHHAAALRDVDRIVELRGGQLHELSGADGRLLQT